MRPLQALDLPLPLPPPPSPPPLQRRHDALLEFEAREAALEDEAVEGALRGCREELQAQELAALHEAVARDLACGWLLPPPMPAPAAATLPALSREPAWPQPLPKIPPPPTAPPTPPPQPAKLANTGFCGECDRYIARVLADLCGYKLAALVLAAAAAAPSNEDALRLAAAAARADGQALAAGGGDGAHRPGDGLVRLLDERTGRAFCYNTATGGAEWEVRGGAAGR